MMVYNSTPPYHQRFVCGFWGMCMGIRRALYSTEYRVGDGIRQQSYTRYVPLPWIYHGFVSIRYAPLPWFYPPLPWFYPSLSWFCINTIITPTYTIRPSTMVLSRISFTLTCVLFIINICIFSTP